MRDEAEQSIAGGVYCQWVDNYNKFRYSRNPNENRDKCVNATVLALLAVPDVSRHRWSCWPEPGDMYDRVASTAAELHHHHRRFNDRVRNLMLSGLQYDNIRVPCDLRRFAVQAVAWRPYMVLDADIKSTQGLVQALESVLGLRQKRMGLCCMVMDVNIFWRVLKLAYAFGNLEHNLLGALRECVPMLGVWHAYAYTLKKVYSRFLPWWAALENATFLTEPDQCNIYTKPRIVFLEQLVMGTFLAGPDLENDFNRAGRRLRELYDVDGESPCEEWDQYLGLKRLVQEYCPALVEMGIGVRQCFWKSQAAGTGDLARRVLRDAIVVLQATHVDGSTEYLRNISLMELMWVGFHSEMPAAVYVEEALESSLSTLARRLRTDTRSDTVGAVSDTYTQEHAVMWYGLGGAFGVGTR
jgi:hypothetical protein